jgi:Xaa-Pro aminopeptidase
MRLGDRRDPDRIASLRQALSSGGLDAVVCTLPTDVLLLTGYWPVVGTSIAVATHDGRVALVFPEDEQSLANRGAADVRVGFEPATLDSLTTTAEAAIEPLRRAVAALGLDAHRVGYAAGETYEPSSYAAAHLYGTSAADLIHAAAPHADLADATTLLADLRARPTPRERERIRLACRVARAAFETGARALREGLLETEAAEAFRAPLATVALAHGADRAGGFTFCMAGPRSAEAYGSYARSRADPIHRGDFVLVHANTFVDGFWTDVTRTYCIGRPDAKKRALYDAIFAARSAALAAIRPGARGAEVDAAARGELDNRGLSHEFKHATGHGVGFWAIDHAARPRLHPKSEDVLEVGMIFNVEPAVYEPGYGGLRHCDVVEVVPHGARVLTQFHTDEDALTIDGSRHSLRRP